MQDIKDKPELKPEKKPISRDQVAWINSAIYRFEHVITHTSFPGISRLQGTSRLALLLEIMDILHLEFENKESALNAISTFPELDIIEPKCININAEM